MKKGFTLIELLAVIVILAIIALIATPVILNIISDARDSADKRSIELYAKAVEQAVARYNMKNPEGVYGLLSTEDGKTLDTSTPGVEGKHLVVDYDGNVICKYISVSKKGSVQLGVCTVNGNEVDYVVAPPVKNMLYKRTYYNEIATDDVEFLNSNVKSHTIKSFQIHTDGTNIENESNFEKKDCSFNQDKSVMCYWKEDSTDSGYYEFHIAANGEIYTPYNSKGLFNSFGFDKLTELNLTGINTKYTITMEAMFYSVGYRSMATFNLGSSFDTSNVITMRSMFSHTGFNSLTNLDLGNNFDTSNVTNMYAMFYHTGNNSLESLNLGLKFDTSKVTNMAAMFSNIGKDSESLETLNLGNRFNTSNVVNMKSMFSNAGYNSLKTLNLGNYFDTSKVTNMNIMFYKTGYNSMETLILGDKFDTSNVTDMYAMFDEMGRNSSYLISLDLGDKFDTSNVTDMYAMFQLTGTSSMTSLRLGKKFIIPESANIDKIFNSCGKDDSNTIIYVSSQNLKDKIQSLPTTPSFWKTNDSIIFVESS